MIFCVKRSPPPMAFRARSCAMGSVKLPTPSSRASKFAWSSCSPSGMWCSRSICKAENSCMCIFATPFQLNHRDSFGKGPFLQKDDNRANAAQTASSMLSPSPLTLKWDKDMGDLEPEGNIWEHGKSRRHAHLLCPSLQLSWARISGIWHCVCFHHPQGKPPTTSASAARTSLCRMGGSSAQISSS